MKGLLPVIILCSALKLVTSSYCFWNSGCPYNYFGTKTPYNVVRGDIRDSIIRVKDCEPRAIWGLFRNGKRYPDHDVAKKMKNAFDIRNYLLFSQSQGNCSLCAQDLENLHDWVDDDMFDNSYHLSKEGYLEMTGIGKRLKEAFPKLLSDLDSRYNIRPIIGPVTEESAKGFVAGLNGRLNIEKSGDHIAAPYRSCETYQKGGSNIKILKEVTSYQKTPEYLAMKDRMQRRSGIDYKLSDENITSLYDLCRYSSSGFENKLSPWCALFTTPDLQVLEYIEDLNNYYTVGYGASINENFGRVPLGDLFNNFREAKKGTEKGIVAYFTQSTSLSMAYRALGLFRDKKHLTGAHRNPERNWRSSKMSGFSSNLIAVLNRCVHDDIEDHIIIFYMNEEPLRSICGGGICTWQEFEDKLIPFADSSIENCKYRE